MGPTNMASKLYDFLPDALFQSEIVPNTDMTPDPMTHAP